MATNSDLRPGTWVSFTADARLRKITDTGVREQRGFGDGIYIGEGKEAIVAQNLGDNTYTVVIPEGNYFGWVYNYEVIQVPNRPLANINFQKKA